jgi:catechol 2,3-dioxygenase-like lactoylglutathione lyase family enzyme
MPNDRSNQFRRREMLALLGAGAFLRHPASATDAGLHFASVDHVGITVSDPQKSAAFYTRLFGDAVYKNNKTTQRYLKLGPSYISIRQAGQESPGFRVDHICPGIPAFDSAAVQRTLQSQGIGVREVAGFGLVANDPDGIAFQLWLDNSWSRSVKTATPESYQASGEPIFSPTGLDHILLDVSDVEKSAGFYEKIFGPVPRRNNNRTWFQAGKSQIGLLALADGRRPGVNHFCVSAATFEYDAAMKKLAQAGANLEAPEVAGAPEFRDPDGILVQVMGPRPAVSR